MIHGSERQTDIAKRQEILKVVIVIKFLAVGLFVSSCEPAALDHPSFQDFLGS